MTACEVGAAEGRCSICGEVVLSPFAYVLCRSSCVRSTRLDSPVVAVDSTRMIVTLTVAVRRFGFCFGQWVKSYSREQRAHVKTAERSAAVATADLRRLLPSLEVQGAASQHSTRAE